MSKKRTHISNLMKKLIVIATLLNSIPTMAQNEELNLTLSQAIEIAQQHSPEAQAARHTYRAAYWNYRFYKANYLPSVTLSSSPSFNKQISKITQPDGTNLFIKQNQLSVDMDLKINQNIWFTGGSLFVRSNVQRLDELENNVTAYNTQPVVIGYEQALFGYNSLKWNRRIEPVRFREARKAYNEALELVASQTSNFFFNLATAQTNLDIASSPVEDRKRDSDTGILLVHRVAVRVGKFVAGLREAELYIQVGFQSGVSFGVCQIAPALQFHAFISVGLRTVFERHSQSIFHRYFKIGNFFFGDNF